MNTETAATGQPSLPGYVQSFDGLRNVAHLGKALHAMHACSCTAIKKSRDCGLPELEAGFLRLASSKRFDLRQKKMAIPRRGVVCFPRGGIESRP